MRNAIIASTALMASSALAQGTAHVVNQCSYEVYLCNTPASGGGFEQIDEVLSPGGSYSQQWTVLGNGMGWSIKLAKTDSYQTDLMQYEYTYHDDGTIWYDLSEVDGNPWDGNWMITATGSCNPKQQAYRYSTDDAYGMQSCPDSASITVTLCSGDSSSSREASSAAAPAPSSYVETSAAPSSYVETSAAPSSYVETSAATSVAPAPSSYEESSTTEAPVPTTTATGGWNGWKHHTRQGDVKAAEVSPSPTTMVTQKVSVSNAGGYDVTVTDVATEVVTAYVTAAPKKRHEHHPRHPHHVREE